MAITAKQQAKDKQAKDQAELLESLIEQGFDLSEESDGGRVRIRCSQCEALAINGIPCHEQNCPNIKRGSRNYDDEFFGTDSLYDDVEKFDDPKFNPRWPIGTAAYTEIVELG